MKKTLLAAAAAAAAIFTFSSCQKEPSDEFKGSYTFKTGGWLVLESAPGDGQQESSTATFTIKSESGQMEVLPAGEDGNLLVTLNVLGGGVNTFDACVEEGTLLASPFTRAVSLTSSDGMSSTLPIITVNALLTMECSARRLGGTLVFDAEYSGEARIAGRSWTVAESHVEFIAKRN